MSLPSLALDALAGPPDWDAVFGFPGPLELEIGSGKGGFAADYGARHPERRLVALERRALYARMTHERVAKAQLANVLVLQADAKEMLERLFAPESLEAIHLYFPDPWWKRRHFKRRVVEPAFAARLRDRLKREGWLHLRTDVAERAEHMRQSLLEAGLAPAHEGFAPFDPEEVPTTREKRYLASGEPVFRLHLRRLR